MPGDRDRPRFHSPLPTGESVHLLESPSPTRALPWNPSFSPLGNGSWLNSPPPGGAGSWLKSPSPMGAGSWLKSPSPTGNGSMIHSGEDAASKPHWLLSPIPMQTDQVFDLESRRNSSEGGHLQHTWLRTSVVPHDDSVSSGRQVGQQIQSLEYSSMVSCLLFASMCLS